MSFSLKLSNHLYSEQVCSEIDALLIPVVDPRKGVLNVFSASSVMMHAVSFSENDLLAGVSRRDFSQYCNILYPQI